MMSAPTPRPALHDLDAAPPTRRWGSVAGPSDDNIVVMAAAALSKEGRSAAPPTMIGGHDLEDPRRSTSGTARPPRLAEVIVAMPPAASPARPARLSSRTMLLAPVRAAGTSASTTPTAPTRPGRPFVVEVSEDTTQTRYRDAISVGDDYSRAMLVMTDFSRATGPVTEAALLHFQAQTRRAVARGDSPSAILHLLDREIAAAGYEAIATCVLVDARERRATVACAGAKSPLFFLRGADRIVRARASSSDALGQLRTAQFAEQVLHFGPQDTLYLASTEWAHMLERLLEQPIHLALPTLAFAVQQHRVQPIGGALLHLGMRSSETTKRST